MPAPSVDPDADPSAEPSPDPSTDPSAEPSTGPNAPTHSGPGEAAQQALDTALTKAQQAIEAGQDALADGDFAAYGQAQDDLAAALEDAVAASRRLNSAG